MRRAAVLLALALGLLPLGALAAAPQAWTTVHEMSTPRNGHTATLLKDGRVLVAGGSDGRHALATVELFDPRTGAWQTAAEMAHPRVNHRAALLPDGRVLVAGGQSTDAAPGAAALASAEVYDPGANAWMAVGSLHQARSTGFTMNSLRDGHVLLVGGVGATGILAETEIFDARTDIWSVAAPMSIPRFGHATTLLESGGLLVTGGNTGRQFLDANSVAATELFDPETGGWRRTAPLSQGRGGHGIATTHFGALVAGGFQLQGSSGFQPRTAEHYEVTRDQWTDTDPPFMVASLTGLRDGRVLAVGNRSGGRPILRAALFEERTRSWTPAQPLDIEWFEPTLTPLSDGRVLATGGFASGPTAAAALFDPQVAAPAASTQNGSGLGPVPWQLILVALVLAAAAYASYRRPRVWAYTRPLFSGAFQIAGLFALTWGLVHLAGLESPPISSPTVAGAIRPAESALLQLPLPDLLRATTTLSLTLAGLAAGWATAAGAGGAVFVVSLRRRYWEAATAAAALLWVAPTFLLAILVQELQAFIYGHSGLVVAAGFGDVSAQQVFWASIVLGLRPAAYLYRHTRDTLEVELRHDYPRTAMAKGLSWRQSITNHVFRAAAAGLTAPWLNAFRLMIGALPLVEFFFGYPGLGRVLILALGLTYNGAQGVVREDVIVGLVVTMGVILVAAETTVAVLRHALDPRLRQLRPA